MADQRSARSRGLALGTRWLGVGLASIVAVITVGLAVTGRIGLYINPDAAWWAVSMSVVVLVGAVASSMVPVGVHEHGHGDVHGEDERFVSSLRSSLNDREEERFVSSLRSSLNDREEERFVSSLRSSLNDRGEADLPKGSVAERSIIVLGGVAASVFVGASLVLPPASLSTELALARSSGAPPQLSTSATLTLASSGDTSEFGIGEWSSIIATTTDPAAFAGDPATLTGFVGPADGDDEFRLTRLVIVHCVIDAQAASVPVADPAWADRLAVGEWVEVSGAFVQDSSGSLVFEPASVVAIDEPGDPYEY